MTHRFFPFDLFDVELFAKRGGPVGKLLRELAPLSMSPPMPWGQWLYARLITERANHLKGDFIECGVGQGGMSLFLGHLAQQHGRNLYALDSFSGLPKPRASADNAYFRKGDYGPDAKMGDLVSRFKRHVADKNLSNTIRIIRGLFARSLSALPGDAMFSFIHIDADLHDSVLECLALLYPRLVTGGLLAIDDFFHHAQGPARAFSHYFSTAVDPPLLHVSFPYSVVVIKGEEPPTGLHRSLDGNRYSLRLLREDNLLAGVVENALAKAERERHVTAAANARRLLQILNATQDASSDIYEYWRALADYWDDMDAGDPKRRKAITI